MAHEQRSNENLALVRTSKQLIVVAVLAFGLPVTLHDARAQTGERKGSR